MKRNTKEKTNTGYRKWTGKYWVYYKNTKCAHCGKDIYVSKNPSNKHKPSFCPDRKACMHEYYLKKNDPLGYGILNSETDDLFYLIGLISTDGHISWTGCTKSCKANTCTIELNKKDRKILEQIKSKFGGNIYKTKNGIAWILHNRQFVEYLRDIVGLSNNKSLNLDVTKWFNKLDKIQQKYFMRGVFDGDGFICKNNNGYWAAGICSYSPVFLDMIEKYFNESNTRTGPNEIRFNGKYIIKPLEGILTEDSLHLHRKYKKFKELLKELS